MAEESLYAARLIPTSGIDGDRERERRATSALLAVMAAVTEFGRALTKPLGAPAGNLQTYVEMPFDIGEKRVFPDGLIRASRGQKSWTALVEVKTGENVLVAEQIENYLDVARAEGFDAVITISNEIPPIAGQHPTVVDRRKLRRVALHHLSWTKVLSEAVMQREVRGVADPDQAWILSELIRYLEHSKSGAMAFNDMGDCWVTVRDAVKAGTLRASDKGVAEVASRFDALLCFASLDLGKRLGTEVMPALSREEFADPASRTRALTGELARSGQLAGAIRIPATVGDVVVTADLRAGTVTCHVEVDAPREGRPTTRVNWLLRQLKAAPDGIRIEAHAARERGPGAAELLGKVRENPSLLIADPAKDLRSFRVAMTVPMGTNRKGGRGSFIGSVTTAIDAFYGDVVGHLKAWAAAPPRLRSDAEVVAPDAAEVPPTLVSTALSSQDKEVAEVAPTAANPEA